LQFEPPKNGLKILLFGENLERKTPFGENLGENNGEKKSPSNTIELHGLAMPLTE